MRRVWLNNDENLGTAFVAHHVSEYGDDGKFDSTFRVADCHKIVGLDFDCFDWDSVANAKHKSAVLRREVTEFLDALDAAIAKYESLQLAKETTHE